MYALSVRLAAFPAFLALVLIFLPFRRCYSQAESSVVGQNSGTTRTIQGIVLGQANAPVPGAVVLLKNTKTLEIRSFVAQSDGSYHFVGLSTDVNFQLRAQSGSLTSKTKTISVFDSHKVVNLNLKLSKARKG